ncbi:caspase family protein [Pseudonocardia endophytica]|uniref:Caspase domain-containing protein n=1 Tax=Pseudonocardia endophytica TaxID=401976 RepID=A0A4V2PIN0_PSEEN|nr:caspase family protein [Pseudonocardia endophytica]TCK25226.1 caspase domain-containing protein [Pseudonocardia endophytica]
MTDEAAFGRLPDPSASRVVLIGASEFSHLSSLPSVSRNVAALSAAFRNLDLWGLPQQHCVTVQNPDSLTELVTPVDEAASCAEDTLIVYYSGHGLVDRETGELHLALRGSIADRSYTAVRYDLVRQQVLRSPARRKLIILDCCYSGRALGLMGDAATALAEEAAAEGTLVIASAPENSAALAPEGENFTAFTGELLDVLDRGVNSEAEYLDVDLVYRRVFSALKAKIETTPAEAREKYCWTTSDCPQ